MMSMGKNSSRLFYCLL